MRLPDLSGALGVAVRLHAATTAANLEDLTPAERAAMPGGSRRHDWLLGRAALKALLSGADTASLRFPHRSLSLTHSSGLAVAALAAGAQAGVGVDYEGPRRPDPRTARFFLRNQERRPGEDLLRLWTVKEALFKATPDNAGAALVDCELADPQAVEGSAAGRDGWAFRYASTPLGEGWLTVAVCHGAA